MSTNWVLDASVMAKGVFHEPDSDQARKAIALAPGLIAPDFIFVEVASIAAKKVRRKEESQDYAVKAMLRAEVILDELFPSRPLAPKAFDLAAEHGVSVYDGLYLALAIAHDCPVLTADIRLVERCERAGLSRFMLRLDQVCG